MAYSAPMIVAGLIMLVWAYTRVDPNTAERESEAR